ncbi:hypothetical protein ABE137_10280 [Brevibacillus laterosporus]|uniref:hypothetical protein n=1 Tax=Brevibacillus laterosporus TaxID=1465 RepID=UPI003D220922
MGITQNQTIQKVIRFLTDHKQAPYDARNELVDAFIRGLDVSSSELQTLTMRHPDLVRKSSARRYSVLEVLADFILDVGMINERGAEYPITNASKDFRRAKERDKLELFILTDGEPSSARGVYETAFSVGNSVEDAVFNDEVAGEMTAESLRKLIRGVQNDPEPFIRKHADGSAWNREQPEKKRTRRAVRATIRGIDLRKIRTCRVCKNGFYSRNGRYVCDVVESRERRGISVCDRAYEKNYVKYREVA